MFMFLIVLAVLISLMAGFFLGLCISVSVPVNNKSCCKVISLNRNEWQRI